jgi:excinuclease UvrABC ATPase subunit
MDTRGAATVAIRELAKTGAGNALYNLDEPATGLHFQGIRMVLTMRRRLKRPATPSSPSDTTRT